MIEVFKTNIRLKREARQMLCVLSARFPACKMNFDLTDRDRIFRVQQEHIDFDPQEIIRIFKQKNFHCEVLNS